MILEYKLDAGPHGMVTPYWVKDGGYFYNPDNYTFVGWSPDVREYKIPDSVLVLTQEELVSRVLAIHSLHPFNDELGTNMTTEQVTNLVNSWYSNLTNV